MEKYNLKKTGKLKRLAAIRSILNKNYGSTHEKIKVYLGRQGIKASQSTLSRDLREIGAVKIPVNGGNACYRLSNPAGEFSRTISNYKINYEAIGNLLVIKTTPGMAPGFCAILDNQRWDEIAGTIAGDDTALIISRTPSDVANVIAKLENII